MLSDRLTRGLARVVLVSYITHLLAPVVHACETVSLPERSWGQHLRDPSPPREAALQHSFQQSLDFKPRVETLKPSSDPSDLPLNEERVRFQAQTYQYSLNIQTLSLENERFKLDLSRKLKESQGPFERLHTDTIRQGKLTSSSSEAEETQDDALLNLFQGAAVHKFSEEGSTVCYSWQLGGAIIKIAKNGSVFFDQGSVPLLSSYDFVIKTSGELFLESLGVQALTLQSPKTQIIGTVVADHLHTDQILTNEGGLQVKQLTGKGRLTNHAVLKLDGTQEKKAILGVRTFINEQGKDTSKQAKVESSHLQITSENLVFFNGAGSEFRGSGQLTVNSSPINNTASFINKGTMYLYQATLNRKTSNSGFWQTTHMTVMGEPFANQNFGTLNILDQLLVTSSFSNEGEITIKNLFKVNKGVNKGTIKGQALFLETQGSFKNEGDMYLKALIGPGIFYNDNILKFSTPDNRHGSIDVAHFRNGGDPKAKTRAKITGEHVCVGDENQDVWNYDDIFVNRFQTANQCARVPATSFKNFGHIEAQIVQVDSGSGNHLWENAGAIKTAQLQLSGNRLSITNTSTGILKIGKGLTSAALSFINHGEIQANQLSLRHGHNTGNIYGESLILAVQKAMINTGKIAAHEITGAGIFSNANKLQLLGMEKTPAKISIKNFENGKNASTPKESVSSLAHVRGSHIVVTSTNEKFTTHTNSEIVTNADAKGVTKNNLIFEETAAPSSSPLELKGNIHTDILDIYRKELINSGMVSVKEFSVHGKKFLNAPNAHLHVEKAVRSDVSVFQNDGKMVTERMFAQQTGAFINVGGWNHTGDIDLGYTQVSNRGTMQWHKGKWDFAPKTFENHGNWLLDQMVISQLLNMTNHGVLELQAGTLSFGHLINHKALVVSGGSYSFSLSFINKNLMQLLNHDWTFTDGETSYPLLGGNVVIPNGNMSKVPVQLGKIECDKSYTHDAQAMPESIIAKANVAFTKRYQQIRTLNDLSKVKTPGRVTFYVPNITTTQNHEFSNIGHLDLYVDGIFTTHHSFKARGLSLEANGSLICGASNDVMGTIAATHGPLNLIAHTIDGRFAKFYGAGPTHIKSTRGDILVGSPVRGVDPTYLGHPAVSDRVMNLANGAFVSSGHTLTLESSHNILIRYGNLISGNNLHLTSLQNIENLASIFYAVGSFRLQAHKYDHIRDDFVLKRNYISCPWYSNQHISFPGSAPAIIESLGDVELFVQNMCNMASRIKSGGKIGINNNPLQAGSSGYTEKAIPLSSGALNHTYNPSGNWSAYVYAYEGSVLQSAESVQINTGNFVITGMMNAPVIAIQSTGSGLFHNTSPTRQTFTPTDTLFIDLTQVIQGQSKGHGFLQLTGDGEVKPEFSFGRAHTPDPNHMLMLENTQAPALHHLPLNSNRIFNPLRSLSSGILNLSIQSALSQFAGKVYVEGGRGAGLVRALEYNTAELRQKTGKKIVTRDDVKDASAAMLLYGLQQIGDIIHQQTYLCIPPSEVNPYQSSCDISGHEVTVETQDDQTHLNNRIIARDILNVVSTKGTIKRETEKYTVQHQIEDGIITEDVAMPQQQFACERGDVNVFGHKDLSYVGASTEAGRDIVETAETGDIKKAPLILQRTVQKNREEDDGWFSSKTISETNISHTLSPTTSVAGRNLVETSGQGIQLIGAKETAEEDLIYNGPSLTTEAAMVANTNTINSSTSGLFSHRTDSSSTSTISAESTELKAKRIILNPDSATFKGTDFIALILEDNTKEGAKLGPSIGTSTYSQRSVRSSALAKSDVGCEGWYEVMQPCRLMVNQVIRKIDDGEIKLESVLWDKDRTEIIGKFAEATYELKKNHTQWAIHEQVIPNEALVVVALAVGLATQGWGASLIKTLSTSLFGTVPATTATGLATVAPAVQLTATGVAVANAGFSAVCAQAASSIGRTGDLTQVGKDLTSASSIRSLGITMLSAGLCQHIGAALDIDMNPGLTELINPEKQVQFMSFLQANALKTVIETPLQCIIGQQPVEDAVLWGIKSLGANTVASYFAYHIGKIYGDKNSNMGYLQHKGAHGALGAAAGWLLNPTQKGLISGAIGGVVSEVIMDERREIAQEKAFAIMAQAEKEGIPLEGPEFKTKLYESLLGELAFAKLGGATVAALLGQDPSVAFQTGSTAVENNAIMLAIGLGLAAKEVYDIIKIAQNEGPLAALERVAIDGVIILATAGGGKIAIALADITAFKAEWIWATYMAQNPAFAQVARKVFMPVVAGASAGASKVKDLYNKADQTLERGIANIWQKTKEFSRGPKPINPVRQHNSESIRELTEDSRELFGILGENLFSATAESTGQLIVKGAKAIRANQLDPRSTETLLKLREDLARFVFEGDRLNHPNPLVRNFAQNLKVHLESADLIMPGKPTIPITPITITPEQMRGSNAIQQLISRLNIRGLTPKKEYFYGTNIVSHEGRQTFVGQLPMKDRRHYAPPTPNNNRLNPNQQGLHLVDGKNTGLSPLIPRPFESPYYSTIFEARLTPNSHFPNKSERLHFQESNKQLYQFLRDNPSLKTEVDKVYPWLYESINPSKRGIYPSKPPGELSWHHNIYEKGLMELMPKSHHQAPGPVQHNLHPGKKGGMEAWGGGYPKKKINRVKKIKEEDNG